MFKFCHVSELLETLQAIAHHNPPYTAKEQRDHCYNRINVWFKSYRKTIDSLHRKDSCALLSTLLPQRRKDRVYGIQSPTLLKLLGRCLALSASRRTDLAKYKSSGNGDLADCLERVLRGGGPPALPPVTLLEVDDFLQYLAGHCRFSSIELHISPDSWNGREERLKHILFRLTPVEAKWFVRLILKDFSPVVVDESIVLGLFHFLLPDLLSMHNHFVPAIRALKEKFNIYPSQPDSQSRLILRQTAAASLRPFSGIMVARSDFCKARSIRQCLQMTAGRRWLVDRKYDGEYCQIHIDLSKGKDWIKIFSKSGRDSTQDRHGIHDTIRNCLRLGTEKCLIKRQCILVGEMVVYSDAESCILGFDKIRNHVSRAGAFLGVDQYSPAHPEEHLMIVFFDLLLLDDENLLNKSIEQRKSRLSALYKKIDGRAMTAESTVLDFSRSDAERKLMHQFAASNALRHEGLVLKPCDVSYLSLPSAGPLNMYHPKLIKLKKDYILGMGDEADFAVIGASYDSQEANKRPALSLSWTHFHLGCLTNESDVERFQAVPNFKLVATIGMHQCIPMVVLQQINAEGRFLAENPPCTFTVQGQSTTMDVAFRKPFVFEVLGSSYSRPSNAGFFMLRHPRVKKMHSDRTWRECITFDQLQNAAQEALSVSEGSETQETLDWMDRIETSCKRKFAQLSCSITPVSATSILTPRSRSSARNRRTRQHRTPSIHVDDYSSSPLVPRVGFRPLLFPKLLKTIDQEVPPMPTPPISSPLQCTVRPDSPKRKRLDSTMPDDCCERQLPYVRQRASLLEGPSTPAMRQLRSSDGDTRCRKAQPLADVTRCAPQSMGVSLPTNERRCCDKDHGDFNTGHKDLPVSPDANRGSNVQARKPRRSRVPSAIQTPTHRFGETGSSDARRALFYGTVVYVDKSVIVDTSAVQRLLRMNGATIVKDLQHWDRDSFAYPPFTDTVSESQSFMELRKLVLVDGSNPGHLCAVLARILCLNEGKLKEEIEIYDYKVVNIILHQSQLRSDTVIPEGRGHIGTMVHDAVAGRSTFIASDVGSSAETTEDV